LSLQAAEAAVEEILVDFLPVVVVRADFVAR
jgi:hypothetical protein